MKVRALVLGLLLSLGVSPSFAGEAYYMWVDENGVTNYSERNPPNVDATLVSKEARFGKRRRAFGRPPGPTRSAGTTSTTPETQQEEQASPEELAASQFAAEQAERAKIMASNCEIGKRNLARLESWGRIRVNENGTERLLSDEEKEARIQEARNTIRENCR